MSRVVLAAIWLAAAVATGSLVSLAYVMARTPRVAERMAAQPAAVSVSPRRDEWARWMVTGQLTAHHVMIVHVETRYLDEAMAIARTLAEPVKSRYAEILIYFHRPARPDTLPPRRVQWTARDGYVETIYSTEEDRLPRAADVRAPKN